MDWKRISRKLFVLFIITNTLIDFNCYPTVKLSLHSLWQTDTIIVLFEGSVLITDDWFFDISQPVYFMEYKYFHTFCSLYQFCDTLYGLSPEGSSYLSVIFLRVLCY